MTQVCKQRLGILSTCRVFFMNDKWGFESPTGFESTHVFKSRWRGTKKCLTLASKAKKQINKFNNEFFSISTWHRFLARTTFLKGKEFEWECIQNFKSAFSCKVEQICNLKTKKDNMYSREKSSSFLTCMSTVLYALCCRCNSNRKQSICSMLLKYSLRSTFQKEEHVSRDILISMHIFFFKACKAFERLLVQKVFDWIFYHLLLEHHDSWRMSSSKSKSQFRQHKPHQFLVINRGDELTFDDDRLCLSCEQLSVMHANYICPYIFQAWIIISVDEMNSVWFLCGSQIKIPFH